MTLLGLSAVKTSLMEEKMSGNSRDVTLAFQAAETGLRDAELWLATRSGEPVANSAGSNRVWNLDAMDPNSTNAVSWWQERNQTWWLNNAIAYESAIDNVNTVPHSIIEYKQFIPDTLLIGSGSVGDGMTFYQVTSRGTGGSDQARVLVQSTVARRY